MKDDIQRLILIRMSIDAIRREVNQHLDGLEMEINRLIPEEEGRGRHKPTLEEMNKRIDKACPSHDNLRTDYRLPGTITRAKTARK